MLRLTGLRFLLLIFAGFPALAAGQSSPTVAPLVKLLESGKVPPASQPTLVEMICTRGEPGDLAAVFAQVQSPEGFSPALRLKALELLIDAAATRKLKPAGDLSGLTRLIETGGAKDAPLRLAAIRLAGHWKLASISEALEKLATSEDAAFDLQQAAIEGLVGIGDERSRATIRQLAKLGRTTRIRALAVGGLAQFDLDGAVRDAAALLAACTPADDPSPFLEAILTRQEGAEKLAAALDKTTLPPDVAKLALRYLYSVGRSDQQLAEVLSKAAGIAADAPPPTQEEVAKIAAEVTAQGDAARGERIFRRAELSCLKCHAIAQAGGNVGPELTSVGSISPVDYIVNSILNPNLAIKEQYVTRKVLTVDGQVFTGIQLDRDDQRLRLRDATGRTVVIPIADIEQEAEGHSLMPQGLTKFLTKDEFLDLAKFVSELGKPGPYAIRKTPSIQRWHLLKSPGQELIAETPNVEFFREYVLDTPASAWIAAYGMAGGSLPLAELAPQRPAVLYLRGEIEVNQAGPIVVQITSPARTTVWLDAEPFERQGRIEREFTAGKHTVTLRVAVGDEPDPQVKVEFEKPAGSPAQFVVVGGM
jgi:putative heme-binding domain-containing protein